MSAKPHAVFLMGPTASGKTALAIDLAQTLPFEIISVDSALVYRDMDIGTAKPTPIELARAPHHLINLIDPTDYYSAGQFVKAATEHIQAIHARGKIPLLVGGTMLYFKALQVGLAPLPRQDATLRTQIESLAQTEGWPALHQKLGEIDPIAAAKIKPTDAQRIQRALEVFYLTGKPLSEFHHMNPAPALFSFIPFALFPEDRTLLHERIALRVDEMLKKGLIEEVIALRNQYSLHAELPAMRAVGYRQVWQYLEGEIPLDALRDKILYATRQYAKRQMTWLKSWPHVEKLDLVASVLNREKMIIQLKHVGCRL